MQLCVALSDHEYVDAEGGENVISFLVRNLILPTEQEITARRLENDVAGSNQLRTQCAQALHTISTTCVCATKVCFILYLSNIFSYFGPISLNSSVQKGIRQ